MLLIYRIVINLILIISPIIILFRLFKKKEDPIRFKEKFCFFSKKRSQGKLIWFHGASVGEILSVVPLIEKLEKNKKINQILLTSNTLSSSKILSNLKFKKTIHQFFPIDTNYHTKKFLDYWEPSSAFFIDSEIWPNMITNIKNKSISLILLNARITVKTFNKWQLIKSTAKNIFQKFDVCLSSNFQSIKYLKSLGAKKIKYIGNLKFSQSEKNEDYLSKDIKKYFLSKKIWCAASTHNTEEKFCLIAHKKLKTRHKNLLTIIIPRHIDRVNKIYNELSKLKLKIALFSNLAKMEKDTDILIIDAYGKSLNFYDISKYVFIGKSLAHNLDAVSGQNPIEAARLGCKIFHGPNIKNFKEIYEYLKTLNVTKEVNNSDQLSLSLVEEFKDNEDKNHEIQLKIQNYGQNIFNNVIMELKKYI